MKASNLLHLESESNTYVPPTKETLARRKNEDAKFRTKSGRVPHQLRPTALFSDGVLITWKMLEDIPNLRTEAARQVLEECFRKGKNRFGFQLISYSIMSNHLHVVAIVKDDEALKRGAQGLGIRIGKALNKLFGRTGSVLRDRYHAKPKYGRSAIRSAISYVLQNARKHLVDIPKGEWDVFCSARFSKQLVEVPIADWPVVLVDYFYAKAKLALRQAHPDIYPGYHRA